MPHSAHGNGHPPPLQRAMTGLQRSLHTISTGGLPPPGQAYSVRAITVCRYETCDLKRLALHRSNQPAVYPLASARVVFYLGRGEPLNPQTVKQPHIGLTRTWGHVVFFGENPHCQHPLPHIHRADLRDLEGTCLNQR